MDANHREDTQAENAHNADGAAPETLGQRVDAVLDRWFFEAFAGSRVAQSTETWNCVHAAFQDLKRRLVPLLDQSSAV